MLDLHIVNEVKNALEHAQESQNSELEDRLNICQIILSAADEGGNMGGVKAYIPTESDLRQFQNAHAEDFVKFYRRWLYRIDKRVPNGIGPVFSFDKILDALDGLREKLNINETALDSIRKALDEKQKRIIAFGNLLEELKKAEEEKVRLDAEVKDLERKQREFDKTKQEIVELTAARDEILTSESYRKGAQEIEELKAKLNEGWDDDIAIKVIRLCNEIDLSKNVSLDLFCEYLEDTPVSAKLQEAKRGAAERLKRLQERQGELDRAFAEYREALRDIVSSPRQAGGT